MFKQLIIDNQEIIKNTKIIKRDYERYNDLLNLNKIVSFVWPRRVWKTFLMIQFVQDLISSKKIWLEQVVFIDFSLFDGEKIDYKNLILQFKELYPDQEPFFVFDEIQDIANFREFVLWIYNSWYKIFLSWSNSKLLSSELSTHFRWRVFEYKVLPLTFKEVLTFKWISNKKNYSSSEKGQINNIFFEILEFGNYPEIVLSESKMFKIDNLKTYLDVLIYKDLIERYKIENEYAIKFMLKSITKSFSKHININKIYNELKSINIKIWKTTLYEYYEYIKNIFYSYELGNFYNTNASKKAFLYNIWFNRIFGNKENIWQSLENIVFLELLKKHDKVYFKKNWSEIDFYIPEVRKNIQVCYELNIENYKRETSCFIDNQEENILVYWDKIWNLPENKNFKMIQFYDFINDL